MGELSQFYGEYFYGDGANGVITVEVTCDFTQQSLCSVWATWVVRGVDRVCLVTFSAHEFAQRNSISV